MGNRHLFRQEPPVFSHAWGDPAFLPAWPALSFSGGAEEPWQGRARWHCPPTASSCRSVRDSEHEDDEEERKQSRGCALQYQHATLQVFTQFHTTAAEGTGQVVTMLGPDWLVEVTDLVSDFMRVDDPRVAHMVDSFTLAGREPGTTLFKVPPGCPCPPPLVWLGVVGGDGHPRPLQVVSPLMEAVLGETLVTVAEEKVSITDLKAQVVSSLSLSLHPSPGNSHTIIARTSVQQTLSFFKQVRLGVCTQVCGACWGTWGGVSAPSATPPFPDLAHSHPRPP